MRERPEYDRCQPDFMAPSPKMIVSDKGHFDLEEEDLADDGVFNGLDEEHRRMRYYESQKVLGHLYRAIDERKSLSKM